MDKFNLSLEMSPEYRLLIDKLVVRLVVSDIFIHNSYIATNCINANYNFFVSSEYLPL